MKTLPIFCLLALFCAFLDVASGEALKNPRDCPKGVPISACKKRIHLFPFPRVGRRMDPSFERSLRGFGLIKQPRVGRSDPAMSETNNWAHENDEDSWLVAGEKEENLKNLDNYLSAQRRDSNAPWAFFLITPNFQNMDQQQTMDNLITQMERGNDYANEE